MMQPIDSRKRGMAYLKRKEVSLVQVCEGLRLRKSFMISHSVHSPGAKLIVKN
jgi:hypothetical protein